jgi:hypothetical protein
MGQTEVDAHPVHMLSGDYHRMVRKDAGTFGGTGPTKLYHGPGMTREMAFRVKNRRYWWHDAF